MEKRDDKKRIMEVEELQNDLFEQDDNDSQLLENDCEILLGLLPASVWLNVNNMLLDDHCTDDLKNLSDASPFFWDLSLSKRVLFLFPEVLKIIGPQLENEERASDEEKSSILTCRAVCKSWNKSVDHYIDASVKPAFFHAPPPQPRDPALIAARYKYFGFMAPQRLQLFLKHFDQSHHPDSGAQRNPFIGTTVALCNDSPQTLPIVRQQHCDNVITLLSKYGQYIRVLSIGLPDTTQLQNYLWLKECLELVPNLTHLKVKQRPYYQLFSQAIRMDPYFGEHAYRTVGTEEYIRKRILNEMGARRDLQNICAVLLEIHQQMLSSIRADEIEEQKYGLEEFVAEIVQVLGDQRNGLGRVHQQEDVPAAAHLSENDYRTAIAGNPLPVLKNLECLKACELHPRLFSPLIQSNRQVSWLHIEPVEPWYWLENNMDWWTLDFPNLRKLYIKFPGGPEEVRRLRDVHPSFMRLTSLHFEYPSVGRYMGWDEIFHILEQNWGSTLTELKIRLPKPRMPRIKEEKEEVKNACEHGRLALPKLKRLVMWKSGLLEDENVILNFPFLDTIRDNLEEFLVL